METPKLALRYKDSRTDISTIEEHQRVIDSEAAVWWGWWKKTHELPHAEFLEKIKNSPGVLLLFDRHAEKGYRCDYRKAVYGEWEWSVLDENRIPEYYRKDKLKIPAFFLLTSIVEIEYDGELASGFGDSTFLELDEDGQFTNSPLIERSELKKKGVLVLSDLHFGRYYGFRKPSEKPSIGDQTKSLHEALLLDLQSLGIENDIGQLIILGDFTTSGMWEEPQRQEIITELRNIFASFSLSNDQIIVIPGNHDIVRYPEGVDIDADIIAQNMQIASDHEVDFRRFVSDLLDRHWTAPLNYFRRFEGDEFDLIICALNSCSITATEWTEYGYVGEKGKDVLEAVGRLPLRKPTYKFMMLHHHLLPVYKVEAPRKKGISLTLDTHQLVTAAQEAGIQLAIHGHQHKSNVAQYNPISTIQDFPPITILSVGSSGCDHNWLPSNERNTYQYLALSENNCKVLIREFLSDGSPGRTLFEKEFEFL